MAELALAGGLILALACRLVGLPRRVSRACPTMSSPLTSRDAMSHTARNALIAGGVVLLHVAALWALQSGLLRRAAEWWCRWS